MVYVGSIVKNRPKKRPAMTGTRRRLFIEHKAVCAYCQRKTVWPSALPGRRTTLDATVDHVVPVSRGGGMKGENVTLACALCNGLKGDMTPDQWRDFMLANPEWWIRSKGSTASERRFARRQVLPLEETQMILREGKKAWKIWKENQNAYKICPVMTMVAQFFVEQRYGVWKPHQ